MITKNEFDDFEMSIDFKPDSIVNSGIFIRCGEGEIDDIICYEINIWDHHPIQEWRTGAVVTRVSAINWVETVEQWNTYKIRAEGNHIQAWVNETQVVDLVDDDLKKGTIAIQWGNGGVIQFKNATIKTL